MNKRTVIAATEARSIQSVIADARKSLEQADSHSRILEAREKARRAFEAAKSAARIAKARKAHGDLSKDLKKLMGEAVAVQLLADAKLVEEVERAQARGELAKPGRPESNVPSGNNKKATGPEAGLPPRKDLHIARKLRDAMGVNPDVVDEAIAGMIERGEAISEATVRREIISRSAPTPSKEQQASHEETMSKLRALDPKAIVLTAALSEFRDEGLLDRDINQIIASMEPAMQTRTRQLAAAVGAWLATLQE